GSSATPARTPGVTGASSRCAATSSSRSQPRLDARVSSPSRSLTRRSASARTTIRCSCRRTADRRLLRTRPRMSRIGRVAETRTDLRLARDGGKPARPRPEQPMFPGGMELGDEEAEAAARVIRSHNVFRYYGVGAGPHEAEDFEREFAAHLGAKHA